MCLASMAIVQETKWATVADIPLQTQRTFQGLSAHVGAADFTPAAFAAVERDSLHVTRWNEQSNQEKLDGVLGTRTLTII